MDSPIAKLGWLAYCGPAFQAFVLANMRLRHVAAGHVLTHAGDQEGGMFGVVEGQAAFNVGGIGSFGYPGSWWGQGPLFGQARLGSASARTDCCIAMLPLPLMRRRLVEHPEDWEAMAHAMHDIVQMAIGAHADLLIPNHRRRLAATLLRLGTNRHRRFPLDVPGSFACTQEELAGALGLARNSTGRLLRELIADGLVHARYGRIALADIPGLQALADAELPAGQEGNLRSATSAGMWHGAMTRRPIRSPSAA